MKMKACGPEVVMMLVILQGSAAIKVETDGSYSEVHAVCIYYTEVILFRNGPDITILVSIV